MKILALITARGGSKRLPGKNIRRLDGKPLIVWSIDVIKGIPEICDILVTTDDPEIAAVARDAGALVPWLRPQELASDIATSVDVSLHALEWYESEKGKVDGLMLLQPTSPFRKRETIMKGMELFRSQQCHPVVAVSPAESHPMWCFKILDGVMVPFVDGQGPKKRSQDLIPAFVVNGSFYLLKPETLRISKSFLSDDAIPLVIENPEECIDIDTEWDWKLAESVLANVEARVL